MCHALPNLHYVQHTLLKPSLYILGVQPWHIHVIHTGNRLRIYLCGHMASVPETNQLKHCIAFFSLIRCVAIEHLGETGGLEDLRAEEGIEEDYTRSVCSSPSNHH